ncbi:ABC transporter substrate-binding protein [Reyranella sp. CPCC 100927]|uniref:ABC transporter substrate-binding protein n=1 Tax=Reyranella sp. CPCC 100927 TaxID=2599616 RepID=UPI0011B63B0A|nr:ABC transporter substrate-binding protein [Reyranella sp. CPCC 100927]TWT10658.1 ABC transporter substrate-binding protein [Reyranella sp. CPCC 100927]
MSLWRQAAVLLAAVLIGTMALPPWAMARDVVRIGVLKFGTVNWELDVIKTHGLDRQESVDVQIIEFAGRDATSVALLAGKVDVIVIDWIWVSRQRAEGSKFTFVPFSTAVGALMVPADSPVRTLADLKGRRLGIAGGPIDKSWLLIRAMGLSQAGVDLDDIVDKAFGAPPLLNAQALSGRLDGVITAWNFMAELEAKRFRALVTVDDAVQAIGISGALPLLGYVFNEGWGRDHREAVAGLVRASRRAKQILAESDTEWERLRPLVKPADDATFAALKAGFRRGTPARWGEAERANAERAYAVMSKLGGEDLVGRSTRLQPGVFWPDVTY